MSFTKEQIERSKRWTRDVRCRIGKTARDKKARK